MFNIKNKLFFIVVLIAALVIFACGRKGNLTPNDAPNISITSYEGVDSTGVAQDAISFQQKIYWSANDQDGHIVGYAYRVMDEDRNPIGTPKHLAVNSEGWVYHYKESVEITDATPPLDSPEAADIRTIWSDEVYTIINFPANGEMTLDDTLNFIYAPVTSIFEVKCIDNRDRQSNIASKVFFSSSNTPTAVLLSNIDEEVVGKGINFEFLMKDEELYVSEVPDYFEFTLLKATTIDGPDSTITYYHATEGDDDVNDYGMVLLNDDGSLNMDDQDQWEWISTKGSANVERYKIPNSFTDYILKDNIPLNMTANEENAEDATYIFLKVHDLAGLESKITKAIFYVYGGFSPNAIVYLRDSVILGDNHYHPYYEDNLGKVIPFEMTSTGNRYATPFWYSQDGNFEAIGSDNIKLYMHWGWNGEYIGNNTANKKENHVISLENGIPKNYHSEIEYFDIRLDGEPYYYPPIPAEYEHLITDEDGTQWLRVSKGCEIGQNMTVTIAALTHHNTELYGPHKFELRAVDLQGQTDETPYILDFNLVPVIEKEEKNGILIINDGLNIQYNNSAKLDSLYRVLLADYTGDIDVVVRNDIHLPADDDYPFLEQAPHFNYNKFSATDLQNYQLIIYSQDYPPDNYNFEKEFAVLNLYKESGGNLIFSGGKNLVQVQENCVSRGFTFLEDFFGVPLLSQEAISFVGATFIEKPYFIRVDPQNGFTITMDLRLPVLDWQPLFINSRAGLGPISYFNSWMSNAEVIYTYGCKIPGADNFSPTQEEYDALNGVPVALKKVIDINGTEGYNINYLFGFPLTYMKTEHAKAALNEILTELGI
ncbi:MAG: hypothetical protein K8S23_13535 [Candidatus Cloacimonetes bacterium]|nr:hypothetical protein [Candidatus Cloacimonadota bacterium]